MGGSSILGRKPIVLPYPIGRKVGPFLELQESLQKKKKKKPFHSSNMLLTVSSSRANRIYVRHVPWMEESWHFGTVR